MTQISDEKNNLLGLSAKFKKKHELLFAKRLLYLKDLEIRYYLHKARLAEVQLEEVKKDLENTLSKCSGSSSTAPSTDNPNLRSGDAK